MMNGRNNGKKLMAVRIVAHAFEIVSLFLSSHLWILLWLLESLRECC